MIAEWKKTNADVGSVLEGWSDTEVNPGERYWQGIVCGYELVNSTNDGDGIWTDLLRFYVVGL